MLVLDAYNKLANITGFPSYTNATDTPDTTRFLLQILDCALASVIDSIYIHNNVLEKTNTIVTKAGQELYAIDGIIKDVFITKPKVRRIPFNDRFDKNKYIDIDKEENRGVPDFYVIKGGYMRLVPCPDSAYTIKLTMSTTNLVQANDDSQRDSIIDINDTIMADTRFCNLVILKAAAILFARLQNANFQIYEQMVEQRMRTYIEQDNGSAEAQRGLYRGGGHYNPATGLLGD